MMGPDQLSSRWTDLWSRIAAWRGPLAPGPDPPLPPFGPIAAAYTAAGRHYHNLDHLAHCFTEIDAADREGDVMAAITESERFALELAVWFHDLVYDPARGDNEEESARAAARQILAFGGGAEAQDLVPRLIINTKHDRPPKALAGQLLVDIDLSILGQPPEVFDAYDGAIRKEYAHVPDAAFAAGRAAVLRRFLGRASVYATAHFRDRYEERARMNLERAIRRWDGGTAA